MDTVTYLDGSMGVTEKIKKAMYNVCKEYLYIGFLLREVRDYEYFKEKDYADVYEYARQELGFKSTSVKNFIAISDTFCMVQKSGVKTYFLKDEYKDFKYSQLCEMLSLSEKQREKVSSDMTVKEIRAVKKEISGQTSDRPAGQVRLLNLKSEAPVYLPPVKLSGRVYNKLCEYSSGSGFSYDLIIENALDNFLVNPFDSVSV